MAKTARLNYFATRSTFINERYVQGAFLHAAAMPLLHPISHVVEIISEVTAKDNLVNKLHLQKDDEGDGWVQKLTILKLVLLTLLWIQMFAISRTYLLMFLTTLRYLKLSRNKKDLNDATAAPFWVFFCCWQLRKRHRKRGSCDVLLIP